jgi:hypothetical protein
MWLVMRVGERVRENDGEGERRGGKEGELIRGNGTIRVSIFMPLYYQACHCFIPSSLLLLYLLSLSLSLAFAYFVVVTLVASFTLLLLGSCWVSCSLVRLVHNRMPRDWIAS